MSAQHTPGVWEATKPYIDDCDQYFAEISTPESAYAIARVIHGKHGLANARLIAAAPALLAALQQVLWAAEDLGFDEPGEVNGADTVDALAALLPQIRGALAKVRTTGKFAILIAGEDCWTETDDTGQRSVRFNTLQEAQDALEEHMAELDAEGMDYDPDEYRVAEVLE